MEVEYGSEVLDSNGKSLGTVDYVMRNTWTGEISKFMVRRKAPDRDLFISVQDVLSATETTVTLGVSVEELEKKPE
jgi:sporulation protein YlmC with PRC-barrel domain